MDKTPSQIPVNGKMKLSCTKCDWETGELKHSKARQRIKAHMYAKHKDTNLPPGSTPSSSPLSFSPTIPSPPPSIPQTIPPSLVENATYNRKNIRKNLISIQNSIPDDSGSSNSSSMIA